MKKVFIAVMGLSVGFSLTALAFQAGEGVVSSAVITDQNKLKGLGQQTKPVYLMNLKLNTAEQALIQRDVAMTKAETANTNKIAAAVSNNMMSVPVLDQGWHGSCVTFANTAAINALLGKGDYISQLCHLELGSYLEQKGYLPSGWDGSIGPFVLNQLFQFGIVSQHTVDLQGCAGVKKYPLTNEHDKGKAMSLVEFKQKSENLNQNMSWEPVLTYQQRFSWGSTSNVQAEVLLAQVKQLLTSSTVRVTFGVMLPIGHCGAGACAKYHADNDTWALTNSIKYDAALELAGHEMVIAGYDDNAVAEDNEKVKHTGLLILRNSWGGDVGDKGNYYMTYDFFKALVWEVQKITVEQG